MESEHAANEQLANTPTERRANPEMVALAARNRAQRAKAAEIIRTAIKAAILLAIAAAAIFWGDAIVADVQGWKATHAIVVEQRPEAAGE